MIISKTRKWGSSLGIVIPNKIAKELKLRENQDVIIEIKTKDNPLRELFGSVKLSRPTEHILKEIRKNKSKYL